MKKTIRLTESDLQKVVSETVKKIITEEYNGGKSPSYLANTLCDLLFALMNEMKQGHVVEYGEIDNLHSIACDLAYAITNTHNPMYDKGEESDT